MFLLVRIIRVFFLLCNSLDILLRAFIVCISFDRCVVSLQIFALHIAFILVLLIPAYSLRPRRPPL